MKQFHSFTAYAIKSMLLLFLVGLLSAQLTNAMNLNVRGSDGHTVRVLRKDAENFQVLKEFMGKRQNARLIFICDQFPASTLAVLFKLAAGNPVDRLHDKNTGDILNAAESLQASPSLLDQLSEVLLRSDFNAWHSSGRNCVQEGIFGARHDSLLTAQELKKSVEHKKIDLRSKNLSSISGWMPAQKLLKKATEIDLSSNNLSVEGLCSMKPFQPFEKLVKLNLAKNKLDRLPAHFFDSIPDCAVIILADNGIRTIEKDAFAGAHSCSVDLRGNPIETVEPGAMNSGQHKIVVFCSPDLPPVVRNAMQAQLEAPDLRSKALIKIHDITKGLFDLHDYTSCVVVFLVGSLFIASLLPELLTGKADIVSFTTFCGRGICLVATVRYCYKLLRTIEQLSDRALKQQKNLLVVD